jgi:hypothetical protein
MRFPVDRPDLSRASSFNDLTDEELWALSKQQGFFGYTTVVKDSNSGEPSRPPSGPTVQWHRQMDFEPPTSNLDIGRLDFLSADLMNESAPDDSYTERWVSITNGENRFFVVYTEHIGRLDRMLLVAGDQFFYGRNRAKDLPPAPSLDSLLSGASRGQMIEYLDLELSVGRVRGGLFPWEIQYSTLPWREGKPAEFVRSIHVDDSTNKVTLSVGRDDTWKMPTNTLKPTDLRLLFPEK